MHGAVVGGGLEIASAAHIRVAERLGVLCLPEGQRGSFCGRGGSARVPRTHRRCAMTDMMLTGRVLDAAEGTPPASHYLVGAGQPPHALFETRAPHRRHAPLSNFAVMQALPRIADMRSRRCCSSSR